MSLLFGVIAFVLLASGWLAAALGLPVWEFETQTRSSFGVLAAAYLAASVMNHLRASRDAAASPLSFVINLVTVVAGVASAIVLLGLRNASARGKRTKKHARQTLPHTVGGRPRRLRGRFDGLSSTTSAGSHK